MVDGVAKGTKSCCCGSDVGIVSAICESTTSRFGGNTPTLRKLETTFSILMLFIQVEWKISEKL